MLLSLLFLTVFSILTGCHAGFLFKDADKCLCVFITKTQRNVVDGVCCIDEKTFSVNTDELVHTARSSSACFPVFQCTLSAA